MAQRFTPAASVFPPFVRPYYRDPLTVVRAKGSRVWGADGVRYLDGYAGVAVLALGHCHPAVDRAAAAQARRFGHLSAIYRLDLVTDYAGRLARAAGLDRVFLVNSGSEAVDLALCLARVHAGGTATVALRDGYHGGSFLAKSATGLPAWHFRTDPAPGFAHVRSPACHRCPEAAPCRAAPEAPCLDQMGRALALGARGSGRPVLLLEPVPGVGGILVPPANWFEGVRRLVAAHGAVLVVDEVQTGFGRCGDRLFGYQKFGLAPELVALGKGAANGYPLGAVAMTEGVARSSSDLLHFNTFGGHPVSVAAAQVVLDHLLRPGFLAGVARRGARLLELLRSGLRGRPVAVRGVGFMLGLEVDRPEVALACLEECRRRRLLVGLGGRDKTVVRLQPALTFTDAEADEAAGILVDVLGYAGSAVRKARSRAATASGRSVTAECPARGTTSRRARGKRRSMRRPPSRGV